jgi:hypothetical protein
MIRPLVTSVLIATCVVFAGSTARAADVFNAFGEPGDTAMITKSGDSTLCYDSTDAMAQAAKAASVNDSYGFKEAVTGHAILLHAGNRVLLLGNSGAWNGKNYGAVQFRVTSGSNAGVACWVPGYLENLVNNIRKPAE